MVKQWSNSGQIEVRRVQTAACPHTHTVRRRALLRRNQPIAQLLRRRRRTAARQPPPVSMHCALLRRNKLAAGVLCRNKLAAGVLRRNKLVAGVFLEVAEDLDVVEGDELAQRREAHVVNVAAQRRAGRQAKAGKRENELLTDAWTTTPLRRARRPLRIILCCIILYYIILY